uniref:Uncharacterized protein n=1 Tax=Trypanosoma congolense (strain IL3000) TaxID=1068625 RepID=G0UJX6_TRYCI|nr:conserved hypothetical protein [Trypanosoma congolense IL3000]
MAVPPSACFRQCSLTYGTEPSTIHISQQFFSDYIWILVTEDDTCIPGVVLRFDPREVGPCASYGDVNSLPSLPCECLLGIRDHPLTNAIASSVSHALQREGEQRPLLLCISVTKTAKRLKQSEERIAFVREVKNKVMMLARGEGDDDGFKHCSGTMP